MKKIISLFTTLCIVFTMLGTFTVFAEDTDITEISTLAQLEAFRDDVNSGNTYDGKTVRLTADIDMSKKYGEGKESWTPIGTKEHPFNGIFRGSGRMIDNLYINSKNMNSGLFGHTDSKSIITHLTVGGCLNVNTDTNDSPYAGAIVGHNQGIIDGCNSEASVNAVDAAPSGGVISGGIAGFNRGIIRKCTNSGTVSTKTILVGGICGRNFGLIENCFNAGYVSGKYLIGGLCAQLITCGRISKCFNIGLIDGEDCVGDMAGDDGGTGINNVYYCKPFDEITSDIGTAKTAEQFASGEVAYLLGDEWGQNIGVDEYPVIGGDKVYLVNNTYTNTAPNTETADITEISTLAQLEAFRDDVNSGNTYEGKTVKLTADIDMSEKYGEGKESWTPIGNSYDNVFLGTFDGCNHIISNLYINIPEYTGVDDFGLFGFVDGTLEYLNVNGSVNAFSDRVAGVVVSVGENGTVINCSFDGAVKGNTFVSGIAVLVQGVISDCHCSGTVDGVHMVGGIVSNVSYGLERDGIVENCTNESTVTAGSMAGGIVGVLNIHATARGCVNKGEVKGVVSEYEDAQMIGGIAGSNENSIIENCYNTGLVSGKQKIGGITGMASVPSSDYYTNKLAVKNCYNIGNVTAISEETAENIGSIIGENIYDNGDIANNYYLDTCISDAQSIATALTTEQFADKSNFTNWDFETVWKMDATLGRPVLRSNTEKPPVETHTHKLEHNEAVSATCTERGTGEYWRCLLCNKLFLDEECTKEINRVPIISATGHTELTDTAIEPTCETDGKTAGSHCSVCNTVITEQTIIPKLNHDWGEWTITKEPTFVITGKAERICKNDSTHKEIVTLPHLTDTNVWEEDLKVEPTETEQGLAIYTSEYGNVQIIIPALQEKTYPYKIMNLFIKDKIGGNSIDTIPENSSFIVEYYLGRTEQIYGKTMVAIYDEDGALIAVKSQKTPQPGVTSSRTSRLPFEPTGKTVGSMKVFVWDSFNSMTPLAKVETITFAEQVSK